jgi:uncharacterized protein YutD
MNKKQNTSNASFTKNETNKAFKALLNRYFTINGLMNFDKLRHSIIYDDKLQIIYANIRV